MGRGFCCFRRQKRARSVLCVCVCRATFITVGVFFRFWSCDRFSRIAPAVCLHTFTYEYIYIYTDIYIYIFFFCFYSVNSFGGLDPWVWIRGVWRPKPLSSIVEHNISEVKVASHVV